jgi:AraC-like DNA-binding protein
MEPSLPAVHALHLLELVKPWGVTGEELLRDSGLVEGALAEPDARVAVPQMAALVERARALTGEPALGMYAGMHMRVSSHGYLGFAALTASNVRQALELAEKYAPTRTTALVLRLTVEDGTAQLVVEERADFGAARDAMVFALVIGIWQIGNALTGRELTGSADFAFPEPAYFAKVARFAPRVRFGQPANRLVFDASVLELPLVMADPESLRLAQAQCDRALAAMGDKEQLAARVRALIPLEEGGVRSLEDVAARLGLSARTLKRKLAAEGVTYSSLAEGVRRQRAILLLGSSHDLSLEAVAERLGYSDVANFTRAFRRWTGTTPASFRRGARR